MIKRRQTDLDTKIRASAWMEIENDELSVREAAGKLEDLGNEVLAVDEENRRIQVLDEELSETTVVFECEVCGAVGTDREAVVQHEQLCDGDSKND